MPRRCWMGRAGGTIRGVGRTLLVTFAEVAPDNAALRQHHRPAVCNPYIRWRPKREAGLFPQGRPARASRRTTPAFASGLALRKWRATPRGLCPAACAGRDPASRLGRRPPAAWSAVLPEVVRCGRQLETGAHFCSRHIVSSDLASSGHAHGRAIGDEQVPGYARVETCIAARAGMGGLRLRDCPCPEGLVSRTARWWPLLVAEQKLQTGPRRRASAIRPGHQRGRCLLALA